MKCEENELDIYLRQLCKTNELEEQFGRLWTECQTCQGSLLQDILCTNRDCPIFYKRIKVKKDLKDAHKLLSLFDDE